MKNKMRKEMNKKLVLTITVLILLFLGLYFYKFTIYTNTPPNLESFFTEANLSLYGTPKLNQTVNLTFRVVAHYNETVSLNISLPEGLEFINGNLTWEGFLDKSETLQINATVKAIKVGKWTLMAFGGPLLNKKYDGDVIYISVSEYSGSISRKPPICTGNIFEVISCTMMETKTETENEQ